MTMEIEVKNKSTNYIGKVIEIDHFPDTPVTDGTETILNPGESESFYVYDARSIRVEEVKEVAKMD